MTWLRTETWTKTSRTYSVTVKSSISGVYLTTILFGNNRYAQEHRILPLDLTHIPLGRGKRGATLREKGQLQIRSAFPPETELSEVFMLAEELAEWAATR